MSEPGSSTSIRSVNVNGLNLTCNSFKKEFQKKISSLAESKIQLYPRGYSQVRAPERVKNKEQTKIVSAN